MADLQGLDALITAMGNQIDNVYQDTPGGLVEAGHYVEAQIKLTLTTTSHPPGTPTPSRPGEPPSLVTGRLRGSVRVEGPEGEDGQWSVQVGPTTVYGRIQELGGITGRGYRTRLPPRPYVRPALALSMDGIGQIMFDTWDAAISSI